MIYAAAMPNGPSRRLPISDPDEYDRYVFDNNFDAQVPSDDDDIWPQVSWSGHYSKYVIAENSVCHTFCNTEPAGESERMRDRKCVICLENFQNCDWVRVLRCFHSFHRDCVDQWLEASRLCPICKQDITGSPVINPEIAASSESDLAGSFVAFEAGQAEQARQRALGIQRAQLRAQAQLRAHAAAVAARSAPPGVVQRGPAVQIQSTLAALSTSTASAFMQRLHNYRVAMLHGAVNGASQIGERRMWARCQHRHQPSGQLNLGAQRPCQPGALARAAVPQAPQAPQAQQAAPRVTRPVTRQTHQPSSPSRTSDSDSSSDSCSRSSSSSEMASP